MTWLREPLFHFILIGAVIYGAVGVFAVPEEDKSSNKLVVSAGEIEWMATSWHKRWHRLPTKQELDGLIQQHVRETILYREAIAMGLDKDDIVVRRRLAQKLEFLAEDLAVMTPPSEDELQAYFDEHKERYRDPVRYTFTQVYVDPDKRGNATLDDAEAIKAELIAMPGAIDNAGGLGDDFMLQAYYPEQSQTDIQKLFGSGFAQSLVELSPGEWHGPVLSGYGTHLVYVHGVIEPPPTAFAEVRELVLQDLDGVRREEINEQFYASLRDRYEIVIEEMEADPEEVAAAQEARQ